MKITFACGVELNVTSVSVDWVISMQFGHSVFLLKVYIIISLKGKYTKDSDMAAEEVKLLLVTFFRLKLC